ncbi:winged helix DNA-binding domain-containing protein [Streptomyces sp. A1499]|uniref:winged helix DNA-binding domain-containing protein n=1 Tax=Streptomyces sp. A1499 TaxID=2563104 RepID=UPI00109E63D2|nr:winged helix DNA-binding domain-containing protein [Streptomyces sp. A1499]THC49388.1 winged helix DNA-binding domain-containing protein [Streptomyces sp. A1499]
MTKTTGSPVSPRSGGAPVLDTRALNRATLDRQLLLRRSRDLSVKDAVSHLVGLQAQNVKPPYHALAARLADFDPAELSALLEARELVRMVTMRSTIHLHTAEDALTLRPFVQDALERELAGFRHGLAGVDLPALAAFARAAVEAEPRTMRQLREALLVRWPDADPQSLAVAARCLLPLVQVTPRGLWRRSGQVALTTVEQWLGGAARPPGAAVPPRPDAVVLRYLAAFGPASVKDMQTWARLTRLREVFERLRPRLRAFRDANGVELFDLPDAPRPPADTPAPPRFLPEFDNLLLSHADRARVIPPEHKGRTWKGNVSYCAFLVDGFLAGVWRLEEDRRGGVAVLTIEPFGRLSRGERDALTDEAEVMLARVAEASSAYDIRFGTVIA